MKFPMILILIVTAGLLAGCADQSLLTDEEYKQMRGPAPFSPDPMANIPESAGTASRPPGY